MKAFERIVDYRPYLLNHELTIESNELHSSGIASRFLVFSTFGYWSVEQQAGGY